MTSCLLQLGLLAVHRQWCLNAYAVKLLNTDGHTSVHISGFQQKSCLEIKSKTHSTD